jgi:drug/metabolite transporter (DMT)-like permease
MKKTLKTQKTPALLVGLMTLTTGLMMLSFKKNYSEMGFNWMWWLLVVCIAGAVAQMAIYLV